MASPLRIAVIGLGTMAQAVHLPMIMRRHDRFEIAAVVDISPRRRTEVAQKWHFADDLVFASVDDLVSAVRHKSIEVDAAVFAADGVKGADVLALMKRGIPVLVEPPVGYGAEEIEEIAAFERMAGRPLVMVGYGALYDSSVTRFVADNLARDLRVLEFETLMPASAVVFSKHHVTAAAYDLPTEVRAERRESLAAAVAAGAGEGSTQRDRDLYVKGLLTGLVAQLALLRSMYGPLTEVHGIRHWPTQVIPGSLEVLGAIEKGPHVRFAWHYLPFAPELRDSIRFVSTRRQGTVQIPEEADLDRRGTYTVTVKTDGAVTTTTTRSEASVGYALWDAFFEFAARGKAPTYGLSEALEDTATAREILAEIAATEGRSLDPVEEEPEAETPADEAAEAEAPETPEPADGAADDGAAAKESDGAAAAEGTEGAEPEAPSPARPDGE